MTTKNHRLLFIGILILAAAFTRLIPHPANFTALGAMALLSGARIREGAFSLLIPFGALLLSDIFLGFHGTMWGVYLGFAAAWLLGRTLVHSGGVFRIASATVAGSIAFFLLSNFAVWAQGLMYPMTFGGLLTCYAAGLPFYSQDIFGSFALNSLMGDLFFNALLFGALALYERFYMRVATA
jgi:hypothetical protein